MRVIFMGTPEFSVPALEAVAAAHEVVCVYTQPPRPAGRARRCARLRCRRGPRRWGCLCGIRCR